MRLRTYTLHLPEEARRGDPLALDRARLVPDGFSWGAFAFTALWFLRHRLWLSALLVLVLLVGLALIGRAIGLPLSALLLMSILASILIGLEASSLRRWTYERRGLPARDVVQASSLDEAEARAAARWLSAASHLPALVPNAPSRRTEEPAFGFFPWNEGAR